jgi:hypothetical protein
MTIDLESSSSASGEPEASRPLGSLKVGALTAATVLAGALAGVWFYRKTLMRLRQAEENAPDSDSRISEDYPEEDS